MAKCFICFSWLLTLLGLLLVCADNMSPLSNINISVKEECMNQASCGPGELCVDLKCVDLCQGVCGVNTDCTLQGMQPLCSCKPGYGGDPLRECRLGEVGECARNDQCPPDRACVKQRCVDPCQGSCGVNTDCIAVNHRPVCACLRGFVFRPHAGCVPIVVPECMTDLHCPENQACRQQQCVDPCEDGVCGNTTTCHVNKHYPVCVCKPGISEDECKPSCPSELKVKEKTFLFVAEPLPWYDALDNCTSRGMALASVDSEHEWNEVVEVIRSAGYQNGFWLGGHTRGISMIWITTGNNLTYHNWYDGYGMPRGECLRSFSSFKWFLEDCKESFAFVCNSV